MAASCIDLFHHALEQSLNQLGKTGLKLKEGQYEALKSVVVEGKDTICVLPTGYGKSLIYQRGSPRGLGEQGNMANFKGNREKKY